VSQIPATLRSGESETCQPFCLPDELAASWHNPDYELQDQLGGGGMGQVYRGRHIPTNTTVAVKVFRRGRISREADELQRRTEASALRKLNHTNIVRLFDRQAGDGDGYLVMELIEGDTIQSLVQDDGPVPAEVACEIIRQTALALQHMHDRGLIHRDVKPSNLMLTHDGVVKVIDLGLALSGRPTGGEISAFLIGTLDYMAPEQFRSSDEIDARADIYSLGCTLYYLLTGQHYLKCDRTSIEKRQVTLGPELEDAAPQTPPWLVRLFKKMVADRPADRPSSIAALIAQLPSLDDSDDADDTADDSAESQELDGSPPFVPSAKRPIGSAA
jgi:eukaryotic-like serine/threonine-protein kinase